MPYHKTSQNDDEKMPLEDGDVSEWKKIQIVNNTDNKIINNLTQSNEWRTNQINENAGNIKGNENIENSQTVPLGLRPKAVCRQVFMCVLANMSVLSAGMSLGYPAVTLKDLLKTDLNESQGSWFASINTMVCPLGALLSGYLLDSVGRKRTILVINFTAIISWGIMALTPTNEYLFIQIMVSRVIIGITTGLASSPVGVYSAEVCHPKLRGRLTLGTSISTALGILFIYTLGYFIRNDWRMISGIACGYSVFATLAMIPVPESPSWLILKSRTNEAENSLRYFRGLSKKDNTRNEEFDTEMQQLLKSIPSTKGRKSESLRSILVRPEVYKPLLIMISFFGFQQFSGIFVVIVYAVQFSEEAGVKIDSLVCAILIGVTRLLTTFFTGFILDKWGRRPSAIISGGGMAISMFVLASTTWFPSISIPFLPVICIVMYIFTSTLGLMTLPFSMIAEVYPQQVRGAAAGLTICFGYLMSFINIKSYPEVVSLINKENVFAFYGTVSALAIIFIFYFLPETKGKTLLEIEDYFKNGDRHKGEIYKEIEMKDIIVK